MMELVDMRCSNHRAERRKSSNLFPATERI